MKRITLPLSLLCMFFIFTNMLTAQEKAPIGWVKVTANELTARSGAGTNFHPLGRFQRDTALPVFSEKSGKVYTWLETKFPKSFSVYIHGKFVSVKGDKGTISGSNVNARTGASERDSVLFQFPINTIVEVRGKKGDWVQLAPPPLAHAWIAKKFTTKMQAPVGTLDLPPVTTEVEKPDEEIPYIPTTEKESSNIKSSNINNSNNSPERDKKIEIVSKAEDIKADIEANIKKRKADLLAKSNEPLARGWITRLGRVIGRDATHAIGQVKDNPSFHLISGSQDIKLEDYAGKMVSIWGEDLGRRKRSKVNLVKVINIEILGGKKDKIKLGK